jgi:hypothetical protein
VEEEFLLRAFVCFADVFIFFVRGLAAVAEAEDAGVRVILRTRFGSWILYGRGVSSCNGVTIAKYALHANKNMQNENRKEG